MTWDKLINKAHKEIIWAIKDLSPDDAYFWVIKLCKLIKNKEQNVSTINEVNW